jgi:hypothetical protein
VPDALEAGSEKESADRPATGAGEDGVRNERADGGGPVGEAAGQLEEELVGVGLVRGGGEALFQGVLGAGVELFAEQEGGVADDAVEAAAREGFGEGGLPVEGVVRCEGVGAEDVLVEVGQRAGGVRVDGEKGERELGEFDGLGVDVDAVDVGEEEAGPFSGGSVPCCARCRSRRCW